MSVWLENPTIGMSGYVSATSSGSTREMSAITSSGSASVSVVTRWCPGEQHVELAPEEEVDPDEQDRRHGRNIAPCPA